MYNYVEFKYLLRWSLNRVGFRFRAVEGRGEDLKFNIRWFLPFSMKSHRMNRIFNFLTRNSFLLTCDSIMGLRKSATERQNFMEKPPIPLESLAKSRDFISQCVSEYVRGRYKFECLGHYPDAVMSSSILRAYSSMLRNTKTCLESYTLAAVLFAWKAVVEVSWRCGSCISYWTGQLHIDRRTTAGFMKATTERLIWESAVLKTQH